MARPLTTVLLDSSPLFREGLRRILLGTHLKIAKSAAAIKEIVASSLPKSRQLLFIVGSGENDLNVADRVRRIKEQHPTARVVVLSDKFDPAGFISVVQAGADGFILKTISCEALIKSLDLVLLGQIVLPPQFQRLVHRTGDWQAAPLLVPTGELEDRTTSFEPTLRKLSRRETIILRHLMLGDTNKGIARQLGITDATVKVHVKAVLRKTGAANRTQAAIWAVMHLPEPADAAPGGSDSHADGTS